MKFKNGQMPPSPYETGNKPLPPGGGGWDYGSGGGYGTGWTPGRPPARPPVRKKSKGGWIAAAAAAAFALILAAALAAAYAQREGRPDAADPTAPSGGAPTAAETAGGTTAPGETSGETAAAGETAGGETAAAPEPAALVRERARELIPYFENRYFLNSVSEDALTCICDLYAGAMEFETTVKLTTRINRDELDVCTTVMTSDCPELMQLDFSVYGYSYNYEPLTGRVLDVTFRYVMTETEYAEKRAACESAIAQIAASAAGLDALGREKVAFDAIAGPTWYDSETPMCGNAYGALVEGRAKCIGFAHAMKWTLDELGVRAITVTADIPGQAEGHAWNNVCLDDTWYRVDLTPSAIYESDDGTGLTRPLYFALNIADTMDASTYIINDELSRAAPLPKCTSAELSPYALSGQLVRRGEDGAEALRAAMENALPAGEGEIVLQFEDNAAYAALLDGLTDLVREWTLERGLGYSFQSIHSDQFGLLAMRIAFLS